jgi:hypothetical protein
MKKFQKILMFLVLALFLVAGMMSSASAITITPNTQLNWSGTFPGNPQAGDIPGIVGYTGTLDELYKQNVGGLEEGDFASSYMTVFDNTAMDPQDADITYVGGDYISGDPLYLLVKGGQGSNINPYWYIFDLINLDLDDDATTYEYSWNGKDSILLRDFWPDNGAISHVSIYGGRQVPEPATMLLLGSGLIGLGVLGRKKLFK